MQKVKKLTACLLMTAGILAYACNSNDPAKTTEDSNKDIKNQRQLEGKEQLARGEQLLTIGGCNDCHTPKVFGPQGMGFDSSKMFMGHPANSPLPVPIESSLKPGNWVLMAPDITAFVGPWGISYTANLTPDSATGIGTWTEETFIKTLRTGKHLGLDNGRPILPPMPWFNLAPQSDEDLKAIYAFLRTVPAISNKVPAPKAPNEVMTK
jgi:hypothetical protein